MSGEAQPVLEVTALSKRYGDQPALSEVSFAVRDGEVLGLIGPNGAGKTTLLESIAGLLPVDSGGISWCGRPLPAQRRREAIFYLPDGIRPYGDQFVEVVLAFFAGTYRRSTQDFPTSSQPSGSVRCW
jgi:ABC-2 type transport system ATP-binding protein